MTFHNGKFDGTSAAGRDHSETLPTVSSAELFKGKAEIVIVHEDTTYRLKITRQGKLILNK
ncbi:hemin uptake protein HemP [Rhizobium sp. CFBP 8762]|uniref:hemin uptake protein HemP n=1 Tax=Rhizobium sp. CFBP 8762 TaxID=2775279 RepID=UPI001780AAB2|nr:hemin uptake protein HemP [Rhizobium sp. CFBP 8762]MBD8556569.1 hemin uptake protein HemP [Rhizobium sp. CFBP 8762]